MKIPRLFNKFLVGSIILVLLFSFIFGNFPKLVYAEETSEIVYTYICDGINAFAYDGEASLDGGFDDINTEFSHTDYNYIKNNDSNYVYDEQLGGSRSLYRYQYHLFDIPIEQEPLYISRVEIIWRGDGGEAYKGSGSQTTEYHSNFSFWVKETSSDYVRKFDSNESGLFKVTYTSKSLIKRLVAEDGHLYCGIQSNWQMDPVHTSPSYVSSYYIEIKVYETQETSEDELLITAPSTINEKESFQIIVSSDGLPIENSLVKFSSLSDYTNEQGIVTFKAPIVNENTVFPITAEKSGCVSDEVYISVINSETQDMLLAISSPSSVIEEVTFQVTVTSNSLPVEDAIISFSDNTYYTNSIGSATVLAPTVENDQSFTLTASKDGYESSEKTVNVIDQENTYISIISPNGGEILSGNYEITWTVLNPPLTDYYISLYYQFEEGSWNSFAENIEYAASSYLWDTTAFADEDSYKLKIVLTYEDETFEDYSDDYFSIKNQEDTIAWISGMVIERTDSDMFPLRDALVCLIISENDNQEKIKCVLSDNQGLFNISVNPGTYNIEASKPGYSFSTELNIKLSNNEEAELYFILEKELEEEKSLTDYLIQEEIKKDSIIGTVDLTKDKDEISLYQNTDIEIVSDDLLSDIGVNIVISGNGNPGSKIVIYLNDVDNPDLIYVEYDGLKIDKNTNLVSFFEENNEDYDWVLTKDTEKKSSYVVIVNVPRFSQHSISILLEEELISEPINLLSSAIAYISILIISALAITFHFRRIWKK